jgi:hypothetical protein|tara:strand:- start:666 stop:785 length:120 start_codon:yes stop_codon:yes gene_type:complete
MYQVKSQFRGHIKPEPTQEKMETIKEACIELFNELFQEV